MRCDFVRTSQLFIDFIESKNPFPHFTPNLILITSARTRRNSTILRTMLKIERRKKHKSIERRKRQIDTAIKLDDTTDLLGADAVNDSRGNCANNKMRPLYNFENFTFHHNEYCVTPNQPLRFANNRDTCLAGNSGNCGRHPKNRNMNMEPLCKKTKK